MRPFLQRLACNLLCGEESATAVEYAVMLALILMAMFAAVALFGQRQNDLWGNIKGELEAKGVGAGS